MTDHNQMIRKVECLVDDIARKSKDRNVIAILDNSIMLFEEYVSGRGRSELVEYSIKYDVIPFVYTRYADDIHRIARVIKHYFEICLPANIRVISIDILPDYDKIAIFNNKIEGCYAMGDC